MKRLATVLVLAAALAAPVAMAQEDVHGPYVVAALGRSHINYDCGYYLDCRSATTTTGKLIAGYRFGVFAPELWVLDFGKADIGDAFGHRELRLRAIGLNGTWYLHFGDDWKGLLRLGVAQVSHKRTDDGRHLAYEGTFGLGVIRALTPALSVELAWDVTRADGNNTSTSIINLASAGLRLNF